MVFHAGHFARDEEPAVAQQKGKAFFVVAFIIMVASLPALSAIGLGAKGSNPGKDETSTLNEGKKLVDSNDCVSCHALDHSLVGPPFTAIGKRYAGEAGAVSKLSAKIKAGGSGVWGKVPMTPHPKLTDAQLRMMAEWILSLDGEGSAPSGTSKTYSYTLAGNKTVTLDFSLFVVAHKVTKDVFRGYELFNSYCYRCHGEDAVGGELAPDLRHSLNGGMTKQQFITIAMVGRKSKGMPSWAGFFDEKDIDQIYEYVKGRSIGLVPGGRPPSESD
jgi:cytochrome c